jgi:pseudoazurin
MLELSTVRSDALSPFVHRWLGRRQAVALFMGAACIAAWLAGSAAAAATSHIVRVVDDAVTGEPRFDPALLFIEPGDSVRFVMGGKTFASRVIAGMVPDGAAGWWGQVGEDVEIAFTEPGVYGHKCGAAYALGLVGLIVVGDPDVNLREARRVLHPPTAANVLDELFSEVERRRGS